MYSRTPGIATVTITYNVDSGESYTEKIELDQTILSPSTFVPEKSGYDFVGWREDTEASEYVLTESYATERKTLYAVFKKVVTVTYNANGGSGTTADSTGNLYYNNGNVQEANITLRRNAFTYSGRTFTKWAKGGVSGEQYASDTKVSLRENAVFYALWDVTSTLEIFNAGTSYDFKLVRNEVLDKKSTFTVGTSYITLNGYANSCSYQFYTTKPVDVTNYKYITMEFTLLNNSAHVRFGVGLTKNNTAYGEYGTGGGFSYGPKMDVYKYTNVYNETTQTAKTSVTCDISSYSGEYYPTIFQHDGSSEKSCVLRVYKFYLHNDVL